MGPLRAPVRWGARSSAGACHPLRHGAQRPGRPALSASLGEQDRTTGTVTSDMSTQQPSWMEAREEGTVPLSQQTGDGFSLRPYRAMTSADLNQDGHGDLVVGAPGYSRPGRVHVGRVYLIYGNDLGLPPVDLDLEEEAHGVLEGFQVRRPARSGFLAVATPASLGRSLGRRK